MHRFRDRDAKLRIELPVHDSVLRFELAAKSKAKTPIDDYIEDGSSSDVKVLLRHVGERVTSEYGFERTLDTGTRDYAGKSKEYLGVVRGSRLYTSQRFTLGHFSATTSLSSYGLSTTGTAKNIANEQTVSGPTTSLSTEWNFDEHLQLCRRTR